METIGERVARLREALGLSQRELARRAGVHYTRVSRLEAGITVKPDAPTLARLASCLEVSVDYLTTGALPDLLPDVPPDLQPMVDDIKLLRTTNPDAAASVERVLRNIIEEEKRRQGLTHPESSNHNSQAG